MEEIIKVDFDSQTVSARELHEKLNIESNFTTWFKRMCEYGFVEGKDFFPKKEESTGGRPAVDFDITIRCGKEICMIQRSEIGRTIRNYFLDLEDAWNTPEQVMARALKMADRTIESLKTENAALVEDNQRMKPKEIFADAVSTSKTSILVGELAKILKQNGYETGEKRLFEQLRRYGYLISRKGTDYNMPTQKSLEMGLFEIKETAVTHSDGHTTVSKTPKVTGRGQVYFTNKFLRKAR
ncbi:MAG: phage antirepressor KilAC domain-containing protein [Clostridiales bacterium]|nr:phage antirepressor KilAC domain-containing protein [Clostridiales bacterium]